MPMRYYRLFDLLNRRGMKKGALLEVVAESTLAKLSKGVPMSTSVLCSICSFLKCQPEDIMEYEYDESESRKQAKGLAASKPDTISKE